MIIKNEPLNACGNRVGSCSSPLEDTQYRRKSAANPIAAEEVALNWSPMPRYAAGWEAQSHKLYYAYWQRPNQDLIALLH